MSDGAINCEGKRNSQLRGANFSELDLNEHLSKICQSERFVRSARAQNLLHYLVSKSCAGKSEDLKERTIGIDVFGRAPDYDTANDAIVRVAANDLRKRLTSFYQDCLAEGEPIIEISPGSYVPHFRANSARSISDPELASEVEASTENIQNEFGDSGVKADLLELQRSDSEDYAKSSQTARGRLHGLLRKIATAAKADWQRTARVGGISVFGLALAVFAEVKAQEYFVNQYFEPSILNTLVDKQHRILLCVGEQNEEQKASNNPGPATIQQADQSFGLVSLEYALGISQLTNSMVKNGYEYIVLPPNEATFAVLKHNAIISLGGLNNIWTLRFTEHLRFHFVPPDPQSKNQVGNIVDSKVPGHIWTIDFDAPVSQYTKDYAILAKFHDSMLNQDVLVAAGIGKAGTLAAANMATNPSFRERLVKQIHRREFENFEAVISTAVVDGRPTRTTIEAVETW